MDNCCTVCAGGRAIPEVTPISAFPSRLVCIGETTEPFDMRFSSFISREMARICPK